MEVGAVGEILAVDLLEEKLTIFHGAEETPESAPADLKLITGLCGYQNTKMAVAASNSCEKVK